MKTNLITNIKNHRQRGLALIMSLVILLILTLLGVTSMNTSNLQTLMSSNSQYQTSALNVAENVANIAQAAVTTYVSGGAQPSGYTYIGSGGVAEKDLSSFTWPDAEVATVGTSKYIIEYAGAMTIDSASLAWRQQNAISGDQVSVFRITVRSPASRGAMRYLQTIFVTINQP